MEIDNILRPTAFDGYIGQGSIVRQLKTHVLAEKKRKERGVTSTLDHIMLEGGAGLGKTSIAAVIAKEIGANLKIMQGTSIEHLGHLASNIMSLEEGDVFFIDEVHALKPALEEALFSILEDFRMDITPDEGQPLNISLPRFTMIGATTELGKLKEPFIDRFTHRFTMEKYTPEELSAIIKRSASILECEITNEAADYLSGASRGIPRVANNLLKKARNYAEVFNDNLLDLETATNSLTEASIEESGLTSNDRKYLQALYDQGKPVGLKTLSGILAMDIKTIENKVEHFLLEQGFIEKQPRGRALSPKGNEYMKDLV
ncbi:Holliday junction ATP-dependent DNA helicase RuvB [Vibrio chagasii]|nr:Holliday junction ATP-dependent DNA helicase RuvB [Vibrio chagasii]